MSRIPFLQEFLTKLQAKFSVHGNVNQTELERLPGCLRTLNTEAQVLGRKKACIAKWWSKDTGGQLKSVSSIQGPERLGAGTQRCQLLTGQRRARSLRFLRLCKANQWLLLGRHACFQRVSMCTVGDFHLVMSKGHQVVASLLHSVRASVLVLTGFDQSCCLSKCRYALTFVSNPVVSIKLTRGCRVSVQVHSMVYSFRSMKGNVMVIFISLLINFCIYLLFFPLSYEI